MALFALAGTILGSMTELLPDVLGYFQKKQDNAHQLELLEVQHKFRKEEFEWNILELNTKADIDEGADLRSHDSSLSGGWFIDALRASVRPVITYLFFGLFAAIKITAAIALMANGMILVDVLPLLWDAATAAIFEAIVGFWFGSRATAKARKEYVSRK